MAKIPEYFAQEQMETSQLPRAPMGIADVGAGMDAAALARFGGALKSISLDRLQRIIDIETQSQYTAGKGAWQKGETEFLLELENDQDFEGYDKKYKAKVKELRKQILAKNLTSDAKRALNDYIETQKAALGKKVAGQYLMRERDYARASTYKAVRIFEMAGEAGKAEAALIEGRNAGYLEAEETSKRIAQVRANIQSNWIQNLIADNPESAMKAIDILTVDEKEKNTLRSQTRTALARNASVYKAQYNAYVEAIEQDWLMKLRNHQLTEPEILASKLTVDKKQEWLADIDKQTDKILKGKEIVTNEQVKGELESMAYDISTGAVTMPEFHKRLREEWNTTIDDAAYDEIFSLAEREFKSYQAGAMKGREVHALGQLVTLPSEEAFAEMLARLTSKFDKEQAQTLRQLQFDNLDRYKKALRDWLKTKPDANADEIYKEGRTLLTHYRKTPYELRKGTEPEFLPPTKEQIEKISKGIQKTITGVKTTLPPLPSREFYESHPGTISKGIEAYRTAGQEPPDWMLKLANEEIEDTPKDLPEPKTKEEYDKLKSGTKYIDPTGTERIKK